MAELVAARQLEMHQNSPAVWFLYCALPTCTCGGRSLRNGPVEFTSQASPPDQGPGKVMVGVAELLNNHRSPGLLQTCEVVLGQLSDRKDTSQLRWALAREGH